MRSAAGFDKTSPSPNDNKGSQTQNKATRMARLKQALAKAQSAQGMNSMSSAANEAPNARSGNVR